ncbi:MAG: Gfo/Idh/MocA family protein [Desulfovibrio sp.]
MQPIRLGLVGAGPWGRNIIKTFARLPKSYASLQWVVSTNPEIDELLPAGCERFATLQEALSFSKPDGAIIATPPATHAEIAFEAIKAGCHLFIEKPVTLCSKEAKEIKALAEKHNRLVLVDHIHLFNPPFVKMLTGLVREGGPVHIESISGGNGPFREDTSALWDWGAHEISITLALLTTTEEENPITRISIDREIDAEEDPKAPRTKDGDNYNIVMSFPQGFATIITGNSFERRVRRSCITTKETKWLFDDFGLCKLHRKSEQKDIPIPYPSTSPLESAIRGFCDALIDLEKGKEVKHFSDINLGIKVVEMLEEMTTMLKSE